MLIEDAKKRIAKFCVAALNDATISIGYSNQYEPIATRPCVMIEVDNCKDVSTFNETLVYSGIKTRHIWKTIDVQFMAYKTTALGNIGGADDILCTIYNALKTELTNDFFGGALAYAYTLQDISNIPAVVASKVESRAVMSLRFNMHQSTEYQTTGVIEHVEGLSTIDDIDYEINIGA